jgi:hypothetical protein
MWAGRHGDSLNIYARVHDEAIKLVLYRGRRRPPVRGTKAAWVLMAGAVFRQRSNAALEKSASLLPLGERSGERDWRYVGLEAIRAPAWS